MDIVAYLLALIESRKMVGLTNLGTFYKTKIPGRYDNESHSFLPPRFELEFTNEVKENQELANFIAEQRNISSASANYYIEEFVEQIQNQLAENQYASIPDLGDFKIENDQLFFYPNTSGAITASFYGFPNVQVEASDKPDETNREDSHLPESTVDSKDIPEGDNHIEPVSSDTHQAAITDDQPVQPEPVLQSPSAEVDPIWKPTVDQRYEYGVDDDDDDESNDRRKRIFLKTLVTLLIIAAAGAIFYLFFPNVIDGILKNFKTQENAPVEVPASGNAVYSNDTTGVKAPDTLVKDTVKKVVFAKHEKDPIVENSSDEITYELIGSAMKTHKKAEQVIADFARKGIVAKKMETMPGKLIKISLGSFNNYNFAKRVQDSLKKKLKNPEIYIQTIKPKN